MDADRCSIASSLAGDPIATFLAALLVEELLRVGKARLRRQPEMPPTLTCACAVACRRRVSRISRMAIPGYRQQRRGRIKTATSRRKERASRRSDFDQFDRARNFEGELTATALDDPEAAGFLVETVAQQD